MPLVRQRPQRLHEEPHRFRAHREFSGARAHQHALGAQDVADVPALELLVGLAQRLQLEVDLDLAAGVLQLGERRLAHHPLEHHAPGDAHADRLRGERLVTAVAAGGVQVRRQRVAAEVVRVGDARLAQARELAAPLRHQRVVVAPAPRVVVPHGWNPTGPASGSPP